MNYKQIYNDLITKCTQEYEQRLTYKNTGFYYEKHHILPKCLDGSNEKNNLVLLTAKEHYLAHHLLVKIYPNNNSVIYSFWMMCNGSLKNRPKPNQRLYQESRFLFSKAIKGRIGTNLGKKHSEKTKIQISLNKKNKFEYIQNNFNLIIGQKIDKTIIITTQNLKDIINVIGGIDVYLETELKDSQYPNQAYIDNPKSGAPIYKTIYYPVGLNHLDSTNITEYVRSRKSSDLASNGGTDLGRMARQQKLFDSLLSKILSIRDPKQLLKLYNYFDKNISHNLVQKDYLNLGLKILPNVEKLKINKINIPTGENPKTDIIYHPLKFINKQWVFITSTSDYQSLKNFISKSLLY